MTPLARLWRCLGWLAVLAGLWGQALAQPAPLDLGATPARLDLLDHLQVLHDPGAVMQAEQALAHPGWQPATMRNLNPGLTTAAIWLRLELRNGSHEPSQRWLVMGNPRLEHVELFRPVAGRFAAPVRAGMAHPAPLPQARGLSAVFELSLAPGERVSVLLRVQGRTSIVMEPELWQPLAYLEQGAIDDMYYLLPIALMSGLALYLLASTLGRRNLLLFLLALWLLVGVAYDFTFQGYLRRYLMPDGGDLAARWPAALGMLANAMLAVYIYVYLEMGRRRGWRHFYQGSMIALALLVLLALLGPLRYAIRLSSVAMLLFYLAWPFSLVQPWREGRFHVRAFVLALTCVWIFTLVRVGGYLGHWQGSGPLGPYLTLGFKLLVAFVLLYAVVQHSAQEARAHAGMQAELLEAQRLEAQRLEEAVRSRSMALRQAAIDADEAVRAKGELLARVGHDLRSPLTAIMAYATRLEAAGGSVRRRALAIGRRAREQLSLINGLIEYARAGVQPDAVLPRALYLMAWWRSIGTLGEQLLQRTGGHLDLRIDGSLPDVVAMDAKRARQVLELLLVHAAERAGQGRVELVVQALPIHQPLANRTLELVFTVSDEGPPIAAEQLPTLFQPFLRLDVKQAHQGVGLGLAIAHQWAERMGGGLRVLQAARGASLRFSLPVTLAPEAEIDPRHLRRREVQLPELRGAGRLLWVAEDSQVVREMLVEDLTSQGFEVVALADGAEALSRLRALRVQPPDLLLTDLKMAGADGLTLQRSAQARWPGLPVVLLTSAPEVLAGELQGFSAVLAKPISQAELRTTLAELLGLELSLMPEQGGRE